MRAKAVVIMVEQVPLTPFPKLMEAKTISIGDCAVGRAVNDTCTAFVTYCFLINWQPERGLDVVAAKTMSPHLNVFWWILRITSRTGLTRHVTTDGIIAQHTCWGQEHYPTLQGFLS